MCFAWGAIIHLAIVLVVIWAVFAIIRVLLGLVPTGEYAWIVTALIAIVQIILKAIVIIAVILVVGELLACLWTYVWPGILR